jgi:magnesium-transporting ATPase (P-type)
MMQDVEEKRTPLQLNMDELAKKLSFLSFGVIGMICLIGILQKRPWLEMFTIGGMSLIQYVRYGELSASGQYRSLSLPSQRVSRS